MAQVTIIKIVEGPSRLTLKVDLLNNDGGNDLSLWPILQPGDVNPPPTTPIPPTPAFRVLQAWYGLVWFDVVIFSGSLAPVPLWTLARDCDSHVDFRSFGGLFDAPTTPLDGETGTLSISTNGFNVFGAQGTIILEISKMNPIAK